MCKLKILNFIIILSLSLCNLTFADTPALTVEQPMIESGKVTVNGMADVPAGTYIVLRVLRAGVSPDTATPADYLYLGETVTDSHGNYTFAFPLDDSVGDFNMEVSANTLSEKASAQFVYNPNRDSTIKNYSLSGQASSITGNTIVAGSYPDVTGLIANFTLADGATAFVNGVKQISGITRNDFSVPVVYTVVADDGSSSQYTVIASKSIAPQPAPSGGGGGGGGGGSFVADPPQSETPFRETIQTFSDVSKNHWAYDAIEKMAAKDIISGYEDETFKPDKVVSREEFVKIIVNAFDFISETNNFKFDDVDSKAWYSYYVNAAFENGIIKGVSGNKFGVGEAVTRQDAAVMIVRAASAKGITLKKKNDKINFNDFESIAGYAVSSVETMQSAGIINGFDDGTYRPLDKTSRAQVCKMLSDIIN